jgi:hypothetical protein
MNKTMELFEELYQELLVHGPNPEMEYAMELVIRNSMAPK